MPEFPDLTVYVEHIDRRITGTALKDVRLGSPFVLRSVAPGVEEVVGKNVTGVRRLAKQIVLSLADETHVVIHLMIAGRLRWHDAKANAPPAIPKRNGLAAFDFEAGSLIFTEASKKKRASLRFVQGDAELAALDPGGLDVFDIGFGAFLTRLRDTPHTVKRALTDQRVFAGIGNAYSDEILFRARMSPFKQGRHMSNEEAETLFEACRSVLSEWTDRLRGEAEGKFPGQGGSKVTAFHPMMAVHGKYRTPCVVCQSPIQRIVRPENESNYCATCQTGGKLLADRSLSRLLKDAYPRRVEDLELPR